MTALRLADRRETADLAAFLTRLLHYDRAASVRLQAGGGVLAVFGRPAPFEVLAVRTARLAGEAADAAPAPSRAPGLDLTVSAGQLADALDAAARAGDGAAGACEAALPAGVTGPPWAGVLPPRGGWRPLPGLPGPAEIHAALSAAVAEFRARDTALPEERRTRAERDRIGREIWSRPLGTTGLPLRAAHAAQSLGFLRPPAPRRATEPVPAVRGVPGVRGVRGGAAGAAGAHTAVTVPPAPTVPDPAPALLGSGGWLRLRTAYGSIAVRNAGLPGLSVTPA
ncbi:hypothetical protein [Streptomyces zingiberis]|uniref:FAD-binding PCMH-type domain-containing protein n=1 Tax=Streptomyces zingiberis TaxID=2053010 RepID=A0ABX1C8Y4_9ACTN|nr:hypothetical protein [Streptomyces zingiberis]NJQ03394.1 hypothetical protein [Streptomyces zingiberis]